MVIQLEKWYLAENGEITAWIPQDFHTSSSYSGLKACCYTGISNKIQVYCNSVDGLSIIDDEFIIEYEYIIPLTKLKQRNVKWKWQGLYAKQEVEFGIEEHIQENKPEKKQTLQEINAIIAKLNEPPKIKYRPHNFRLSEGIILCQQCGEFLADLKKEKPDSLPPCLGHNLL